MAATIVPPTNDAAAALLSPPACPACGSPKVESFCAHCGEQQLSARDLSVRAIARDTAQEVAGVDGRIPRTLWALITKPGLLTREFIDGRRGRYSKPLSLFLALNVAFFVVQPYTGMLNYSLGNYIGSPDDVNDGRAATMVAAKLAETGETRASYEKRFDATLGNHKKSMLLFAVPVFALAMGVVFYRTKRYFVEHLVFSVHTYAFLLIVFLVGVPIVFHTLGGWLMVSSLFGVPVAGAARVINGEPLLVFVIMSGMITYLTLAILRAYGGTRRAAVVRAVILSFVQAGLIALYHDLLFFTAFYAT